MAADGSHGITGVLAAARAGDRVADANLTTQLYAELRGLAGRLMAGERGGHTLQPTAVVNEALLRLLKGSALTSLADRRHLVAVAAQAMRQVLVDHARSRATAKRGGGRSAEPLDAVLDWCQERSGDLLALHDALDRLGQKNERLAQVVTLRFFGGLTVPEAAEHLQVSESTVEGDWRLARAWLRRELEDRA
jgi:RNA polymerase sigma-70 factor (ECF subfamily)